jgi:flagellin
MDVLGSTAQVELNLFRTQTDEQRQVNALASGLRVRSAVDDPSGYTLAESIHSQVVGLQQGVQNAQTANNLLNVADGTLAEVQSVLQHIHSLIVEAANDFNSTSDLQQIQDEISQLLQEVNKIAGGAKFNGINLLNGSLSNAFPPSPTVTQVNAPALPDGSQPSGTTVVNFNGLGQSGPLVGDPNYAGGPNFGTPTIGVFGSINAYITIQVTGYSANAIDPDTHTAIGPGDYVTITAYSTDPKMGNAPLFVDTSAVAVNAGPLAGPGIVYTSPSGAPGNVLLDFGLANLTAQDVGASMAFETYAPANANQSPGTPLEVNSSGKEGGDVAIELPSVTTSALNIADISVLPTTQENFLNQVVGQAGNQIPTDDAEARVQMAIDSISTVRAQVGAESVALGEDTSVAGQQIVSQTTSESAIRDADIGATATQLTKDQVMSKVALSVQAQLQIDAQLVVQLVNGFNPGPAAKH